MAYRRKETSGYAGREMWEEAIDHRGGGGCDYRQPWETEGKEDDAGGHGRRDEEEEDRKTMKRAWSLSYSIS